MLREIVERSLDGAPDMAVVDDGDAAEALGQSLARARPDVVVVALRDEQEMTRLDPLLHAMPRLACLAIIGDARSAFLYELHPRATPLGPISPAGLVEAIRSRRGAGAR